ncbi:MAG: Bug family tripartite tricarboxylate transporter substrate binding protein [Xanthobacteraceae bacterium]
MTSCNRPIRAALSAAVAALLLMSAAHAQDAASFYKGKTITLTAGFNPGGGADTYARLIARHLGKHVAGNPNVVVKNMQGAGSVIAANYLYNVSAKDGLELGLFAGNIVVDPLIGGTQQKYDARKFNWIGAPSSDSSICVASLRSPFKTIDDAIKREMITGAAGTSTLDFPTVMNAVIGTKFKLVKGYRGSAALRLAMDRGEIEGFCGVGYNSMRAAGLTSGKANILVQVGLHKNPNMPKVPFIFDYAKIDEDRQLFRLVFGWLDLERPVGAPPGVPTERVAALRAGFDKAMKDPALLADAAKVNVGIEPMTGADIAKFVEDVSKTPSSVTARAAKILGRKK